MRKVVRGEAKDDLETFEFKVKPFITGGFLLSIRYSGDGKDNITGAGVWPTVDKAKQVAEESARRLQHGVSVSWKEYAD